jgi:hypothetical protein
MISVGVQITKKKKKRKKETKTRSVLSSFANEILHNPVAKI